MPSFSRLKNYGQYEILLDTYFVRDYLLDPSFQHFQFLAYLGESFCETMEEDFANAWSIYKDRWYDRPPLEMEVEYG